MVIVMFKFLINERGSSTAKELLAGLTGFLTVSYILILIPANFSLVGAPLNDIAIMTAIITGLICIFVGLFTNLPLIIAPGVGLNAYIVFTLGFGKGLDYHTALTAAFCSGIIFFLLTLVGLRKFFLHAIPQPVKLACMSGVGLFLAMIGFKNAGIIVGSEATLVTMGSLTSIQVILAILTLIFISILLVLELPGALAIGIAIFSLMAWGFGVNDLPAGIFAIPQLPESMLLQFDFSQLMSGVFIAAVLGIFFIDVLDTVGTLIGVGRLGGIRDKDGKVFGSKKAYIADSIGSILGPLGGTSSATTFIETAVPMQAGGRTGLTAITVGVLFLLSIFFMPIITAIPATATAPILILVGAIMMRGVTDLEWLNIKEILPAFLTVVGMALTFNIADGMSLGVISYVLLHALTGEAKQVHLNSYILSAILVVYLVLF